MMWTTTETRKSNSYRKTETNKDIMRNTERQNLRVGRVERQKRQDKRYGETQRDKCRR